VRQCEETGAELSVMWILTFYVLERDTKECGAWWKKPDRLEIK
jgi:hypothetical protein